MLLRVVHRGVRREVVHRGVGDGRARVVRPVTGCIVVRRDGDRVVIPAVVRLDVLACVVVDVMDGVVVAGVDRGVIRRWVEVRLDGGVERGVVVQRGVESRLDVGSAVGPGVGTGFGGTSSMQ